MLISQTETAVCRGCRGCAFRESARGKGHRPFGENASKLERRRGVSETDLRRISDRFYSNVALEFTQRDL